MRKLISLILPLFIITVGYCQEKNQLFDYNSIKHSASIIESQQIESKIIFEKIILKAFEARIPFYHYVQNQAKEAPYAILLHGLGGDKNYWVYPSEPYYEFTSNLTSIKDSLLALGFNLIIPDVKFHGERTHELDFRNPGIIAALLSQDKDNANIMNDMITSSVKEIRVIMDYIQHRNNNTDNKFNLVGYSLGGNLSLIINSVDQRINSAVACVPPVTRPFIEVEELDWPKDLVEKMKFITPDYCATEINAPLLLLMGKTDFFTSEQEGNSYFNKLSQKDKEIIFYNGGHELPSEYIGDLLAWLKKYN